MWQRSSNTTILIEITTEQQSALRVVLIAWFGVLGLIFWWHSDTSLGTSSFQNLILSWKPSSVEFLYSPKMINLLMVLSYAGHSCVFSGFGFLENRYQVHEITTCIRFATLEFLKDNQGNIT